MKAYVTKRQLEAKAELKVLRSIARGKKSFAHACEYAANFEFAGHHIGALATSSAGRGIAKRMGVITGVTKASLGYFPIRLKGHKATQARADPG